MVGIAVISHGGLCEGLNMAMLITAALQKSDEITMDELAILCEQAGTEGIKTLKR